MDKVRSLFVLLVLMMTLNSALLTEVALYSRNNFEHHPEWTLGKLFMQRQPFCVFDCIRTRNLMARNRLNLNAWHGFQEVLLNRVSHWDRARFRYRLADGAYLVLVLALTREGYQGLRLGAEPLYLRADPGGKFLEEQKLALPTGPGWHTVELTRDSVAVDGGAPVKFPAVSGPGVFGFRGSYALAEVDDVSLWEGGTLVIQDNFRNDRYFRSAFWMSLAIVTVATVLLWGLVRRRPRAPLWMLLAHFTGFLGLVAYLFVDYAIWSVRYSENEPPEHARMAVFRLYDGVDPITEAPLHEVEDFLDAHQPAKSEYRLQIYSGGPTHILKETAPDIRRWRAEHHPAHTILFLGCSQNWGEGVRYLDDAMIPQTRARLAEKLGADLEVINSSKQGTNSSELVTRYLDHLHEFQPDLVVAYLGSTDNDAELLGANLHRLAAWNKRHGVGTLIIMEANSPENPASNPPHLAKKHAAMRAAAEAQGVPALDLDTWMKAPEQTRTGFLWWDPVHPTSQGHKLAGAFLARGILEHWPTKGRETSPGS